MPAVTGIPHTGSFFSEARVCGNVVVASAPSCTCGILSVPVALALPLSLQEASATATARTKIENTFFIFTHLEVLAADNMRNGPNLGYNHEET